MLITKMGTGFVMGFLPQRPVAVRNHCVLAKTEKELEPASRPPTGGRVFWGRLFRVRPRFL